MLVIDVVTPSKKLIEAISSEWIKIPTSQGEIMVLPGHRELLTLLGTGLLSFPVSGKENVFVISYGFAHISQNKILILAETCERATEIDIERAKKAQVKAIEKLSHALSDSDYKKYQLKLERSILRQKTSSLQ